MLRLMMASVGGGIVPTLLGASCWASSASGTSHGIPIPALSAGDLVIVQPGFVAGATQTISPPSGWVSHDFMNVSNGYSSGLYSFTASADSPASSSPWTITGTARMLSASIIRVGGGTYSSGNPFTWAGSNNLVEGNRFITVPGLGAGHDARLILALGGARNPAATIPVFPYSDNQEYAYNAIGTANSISLCCSTENDGSPVSPVSYDRGSVLASGSAVGYHVAINPA